MPGCSPAPPGADDDRAWPSPVLRGLGTEEECPLHHDAQLCHDGSGHGVVGAIRLQFKIADVMIGLRVTEEHEIQGRDLSQHGEEGYVWEVSA
jgi:hypothetical protein